MSSKQKEALGKFLINFVLLLVGTGVLTKVFSKENVNLPPLLSTLLISVVLLIMGVSLHPKE